MRTRRSGIHAIKVDEWLKKLLGYETWDTPWWDIPGQEVRWLSRRVSHVLSWMPHFWKDYDFDECYLYAVMREKLRRMRVHHEIDGQSMDADKTARQIWVAEKVLDRLCAHNYCEYEWDQHFEKYPIGDFIDDPDHPGSKMIKSTHDKESGVDTRRISKHEAYMVRQDLKYLGMWLAKKSQSWWD